MVRVPAEEVPAEPEPDGGAHEYCCIFVCSATQPYLCYSTLLIFAQNARDIGGAQGNAADRLLATLNGRRRKSVLAYGGLQGSTRWLISQNRNHRLRFNSFISINHTTD